MTKPRKTVEEVWPWIERCGDAPLFQKILGAAKAGITATISVCGPNRSVKRTQRNFYSLKAALADDSLDGMISLSLKEYRPEHSELTFSVNEKRETRGRKRK
jgi:hypothetical protein